MQLYIGLKAKPYGHNPNQDLYYDIPTKITRREALKIARENCVWPIERAALATKIVRAARYARDRNIRVKFTESFRDVIVCPKDKLEHEREGYKSLAWAGRLITTDRF